MLSFSVYCRAMELGQECLELWGYKRINVIIVCIL